MIRREDRRRPPSREEETELLLRAQAGDIDARNELLLGHAPWVYLLARRLARHSQQIEDFAHIGFLTLLNCIAKIDPFRGIRLTTYATPAITRVLLTERTDRREVIRLPGARPPGCEAARKRVSRGIDSLDPIVQFGDGGPRDRSPQPIDMLIAADDARENKCRAAAKAALYRCVPHRDAALTIAHVCDGVTLAALAEQCGLSKQRLHQIVRRTLRLARQELTAA